MKLTFAVLVLLGSAFVSSADPLVFGTYPFNEPGIVYEGFLPLVELISRQTGRDMDLIVTRDYDELSERIQNGTVDLAWIGSANYIKTKQAVPDLRYLATYLEIDASGEKIQPYYQSMVLSLKGGEIKKLEDLEGKKFAFTDLDSTSGYAYPRMLLEKKGMEPGSFFFKVFFLGKHHKVIDALLAGSIDGGAVSDGTYYNAVKEHGDRFHILAVSDPIPLDAIIAAPHISAEFAASVRDVLVSVQADDSPCTAIKTKLGWPAAGFAALSDSFYDSIREALKP